MFGELFAKSFPRIILSHLCLLFSCAVAADIGEIKHAGELRIAVISHDIFPFVYEDKGSLDGIDIRLAKKIAQELGVTARFVREADSFNGVVDNVVDRHADIAISKISATLSRTEKVAFSRPYLVLNQALLFNRLALARLTRSQPERAAIRKLQTGVGVIRHSSYEEYLTRLFPYATPIAFDQWPDAVDAVLDGEVDAIYRDDFEVKRVMYERPNGSLLAKSVTLIDRKDEIVIAIGWDNPRLLAWVDRFLALHLPLPFNADQVLKNHTELLR